MDVSFVCAGEEVSRLILTALSGTSPPHTRRYAGWNSLDRTCRRIPIMSLHSGHVPAGKKKGPPVRAALKQRMNEA